MKVSLLKILNSKLTKFLFSNYLIKGIAYLIQLLLIYFLAVEEIGHIRIAMSYFELFNIICSLGITTSLLKINADKRITKRGKINNTISSLFISFLFSVIISVLIISIASLNGFSNIEKVNNIIVLLSFTVSINVILNLIIIDFQVSNKFLELTKSQIISKSLLLVLFFPLVNFYGIYGFILSIYIGFILTIIILFYYGTSLNQLNIKLIKLKIFNKKRHLKFFIDNFSISSYALLSNLFGVLNKYMSLYMISFMAINEKELGIYSIALTFFVLLEIITTTMQQYFLPKLSYQSTNITNWKNALFKLEKKLILSYFLIYIITNLIGLGVINFIKYDWGNLQIYYFLLSTSWLISSFYCMKGPALISLGDTKYNFYSSLLSFPLVFIASWVLVYNFSVIGVALSKISQSIITACITKYFFNMRTNKNANQTI